MTREPDTHFDSRFSDPAAGATPWADVEAALAGAELYWITTVRADGRPHVTPLPAVWRAGRLHFCTGDQEQKCKNLERDPRCILTTGTNALRGGIDVVVEGTAVRITDPEELSALAAQWKDELDWDFVVREETFGDADGRRARVFALAATKVLAFGKGPYTQTRFRLDR